MVDFINQLKQHARILHRDAKAGDEKAIRRIRKIHGLGLEGDADIQQKVRRSHALTVIARELGFKGWQHLMAVFDGSETRNFGELLYPKASDAYWNIWSARYQEAKKIRKEHGGYLLPFQNQFFIVDEHFIRHIGIDPEDKNWTKIDRDLAGAKDVGARAAILAQAAAVRLGL